MSSADFNTKNERRALDYILLHLEEGYFVSAFKEDHWYHIHVCKLGDEKTSDAETKWLQTQGEL